MPNIILFENVDAYENNNQNVINILEKAGIEEGSYQCLNVFPPMYLFDDEILGSETLDKLCELEGVLIKGNDD